MTNNQPQKISEFNFFFLLIIIIKTDSYLNDFVSNCNKKPTGNIGYILMLEKKYI